MLAIKEKEQQKLLAKLLEQIEGLFEGDDSLPTLKSRVEELVKEVGDIKTTDIKGIVEEYEKLKAGQETLAKRIRTSKRGFYVSGMEEVENFSILKAMVGYRCFGMEKTSKDSWAKYGAVKEYEVLVQAHEKAGQVIGDDAVGGYFIPDQVIADVIPAIYTRSAFINLTGEDGDATRVTTLEGLSGANVSMPGFEGGLIAYWIGEQDEYVESLSKVRDINFNPKKLGVLVKINDSMRKWAAYGFENLLRRDMVRAAAKLLDKAIAFGDGGDHQPRGIGNIEGIKIYSAESDTTFTTKTAAEAGNSGDWDGGELDFDGLDNMNLALEEDDVEIDESGSAWISSPRYFKRLKQLKVSGYSAQTTEKAYLLGAPLLPNSRLRELVGDFAWTNQINSDDKPGESLGLPTDSTTDKYTTVFGGNLMEYVLARWAGLEIEDDAGRGKGFTSDHIYMKLRMYVDGNARQKRALIVCPDAKARD